MTATATTHSTKTALPGAGLTRAAGIGLIVISIAHVVVTMNPYWPAWIGGELRDRTASAESFSAFWAQPGGFAVVVLLLGLLTVRAANRGDQLPTYVGWSLLAWVILCMVLLGPASGFTTALIPAGLLIAADIRARTATR
jgi:hypothetical protein